MPDCLLSLFWGAVAGVPPLPPSSSSSGARPRGGAAGACRHAAGASGRPQSLPALFNVRLGHLSQLDVPGVAVGVRADVRAAAATQLRDGAGDSPRPTGLETLRTLIAPRYVARPLLHGGRRRIGRLRRYTRTSDPCITIGWGPRRFDLGIYDNLIFTPCTATRFKASVLVSAPAGRHTTCLAAPSSPLILFRPRSRHPPRAETMLIIQAVLLGFAAVPLYLFASTALTRPRVRGGGAPVPAVSRRFTGLTSRLHGAAAGDFLPLLRVLRDRDPARTGWWPPWWSSCWRIREDIGGRLAILGTVLLITGLRPRLRVILTAARGVVRHRSVVIMPTCRRLVLPNFYVALVRRRRGDVSAASSRPS